MSDVTRDDLLGAINRGWESVPPYEEVMPAIADAILSEFTLTRKADTTTLDPEPWVCSHGARWDIEKVANDNGCFVGFAPRPEYNQDPRAYGIVKEETNHE